MANSQNNNSKPIDMMENQSTDSVEHLSSETEECSQEDWFDAAHPLSDFAKTAENSTDTPAVNEEEITSATVATDTIAQTTNLADILSLQKQLEELQDVFLRAKADSENIRKRSQEEIARAHKFAIESFAQALLPVKDSLETALSLETPSLDGLKSGVELTLKQLHAVFEKNRVIEISPNIGEKLDPMQHQAISTVASEQAANTIVSVLQKGYVIADRLLRPALVTVAAA